MTEENNGLFWHRVKLLSLIAVFLAPFIAGWLALYVFQIKPENINYGTLVEPVKKLDWPTLQSTGDEVYEAGFGRKWTFVLVAEQGCYEPCRSNLYFMRQIRTLLGRDMDRLQNVLILSPRLDDSLSVFLQEYPNLIVVDGYQDESLYSQLALESNDSSSLSVGLTPKLYLIDPDQNYMMHYPAEFEEHRVLDDIRKLMKLSKIG